MENRLDRFRFHCTSLGLRWDGFAGNLLHSGIGMMLHRAAPELYEQLYGEADGEVRPRRWWLQPPLGEREVFAPLDAFYFEVFLLDREAGWIEGLIHAITLVGQAGLGRDRGRFRLERVEWVGFETLETALDWHEWRGSSVVTLDKILAANRWPARLGQLKLHLLTPLQLKHEGMYVREAPEMSLLFDRLLGRVSQLTGRGKAYLPGVEAARLAAAVTRLHAAEVRWKPGKRYSARQDREMPFGGMVGRLVYRGADLSALYPWFALGEWLQLGAKTTFGLGVIRVEPIRRLGGASLGAGEGDRA